MGTMNDAPHSSNSQDNVERLAQPTASKRPIPAPGSRIYFLAICGTGMSALASLLKQKGYHVAGADIAAYPPVGDFLKAQAIQVDLGFDLSKMIAFDPHYVVIGNFIRKDNELARYVLENHIPYGSFPSTLEDFFLEQTRNFVVVGTHGKSTTTAALAYCLDEAGKNPSFLVGGIPLNFPDGSRFGEGSDFVIEGDEYDTAFFDKESKFLHYQPHIALMMSLEWDHADIFPTPAAMEQMFRKFLAIVRDTIYYCKDWPRIEELLREESPKARAVSFGFSTESDIRIEDFTQGAEGMRWRLGSQVLESPLTGRFNAQNLTAAYLAARHVGVDEATLSRALKNFKALRRRQEIRGEIGEHLVIDDFAHHPTAVEEVLLGMRAKYPRHRLVVFFEARSNTSRRALLQKRYNECFQEADRVLLAPVFKVEALPENDRLNISEIIETLASKGKVAIGPLSVDEMMSDAQSESKKGPCVFLVLSNGAFDGLHEKLLSALKKV